MTTDELRKSRASQSRSLVALNPHLFDVKPQPCESDLEAKVRSEVLADIKARGWQVFTGTTAKATGRTRGEPDASVYGSNRRHWLLEFKSATGELSPVQEFVHGELRKLGHDPKVIRTLEQWKEIVG